MEEQTKQILDACLKTIDTRIDGLEKQTALMIEAVEDATRLAAGILERRLEGMNEFRDQLKDQASQFVTRDELGLQLKSINDNITELRTFKDRLEGKASQQSVNIAWGIAAVGIIISITATVISLVSLITR